MHILNIHSVADSSKIDNIIKSVTSGKNVFILVFMEKCGPCNATRPEWKLMTSALSQPYANNNNLVIVDINKDLVDDNIKKIIGSIDGFPTIKYIGKYGKIVEDYGNSSIINKERKSDSFINWIETNMNNVSSTSPTSSPHNSSHNSHHFNSSFKPGRSSRFNSPSRSRRRSHSKSPSRTHKQSVGGSKSKSKSLKNKNKKRLRRNKTNKIK